MKWLHRALLGIAMLVLATGCASTKMIPVPEGQTSYAPSPTETQVIFMRPSYFGGAIQSAVYDASSAGNELIGIVSARTKVRYVTSPGEHLFMVVSEAADFMRADLEAGKTYYALVTPRFGMWRARFSLKPVRKAELGGDEFNGWNESTELVQSTSESRAWAEENRDSVQSKREAYWHKWLEKADAEKADATLRAEDGI